MSATTDQLLPVRGVSPTTTLRDAVRHLTLTFADAGLPTPQIDARLLVEGTLGIDRLALITTPQAAIGEGAGRLNAAVARRLAREPVTRILGSREFYGREFIVTPDVLDPRADTETVIDLAFEIARERGWMHRPIRIADVGTGSGILITTLLAELPAASGVATDISRVALTVAERNAVSLGVMGRLTLRETRGLQGCQGPFDLVVSNPPYIPSQDIAGLDADVRDFDPRLALDGGSDGLDIYREISRDIRMLELPTLIVVEIGAGQASDIEAIFIEAGGRLAGRRSDLGGHVRALAFNMQS